MSKVQNNAMSSRYELFADGAAVLTLRYRMEHGQMWMLSMENSAARMTRKNVDAFLVQVFQDVHRRRLEALPFCPTVRDFVVRNPTFLQLLPKETPGHFPDLHRTAALQQRRKKTLRASTSRQKASNIKLDNDLAAKSRPVVPRTTERTRAMQLQPAPAPVPGPDQNDLNLAS